MENIQSKGFVFSPTDCEYSESSSAVPQPQYITVRLCNKTVTSEVASDFTLPDYQPEIRRIVKIGVSLAPPASYIGNGLSEFSGNIDYDLIYIGNDGGLYSAKLASPYEMSAPIDENINFVLTEGLRSTADISAESCVSKVTAPRRLNIKTVLKGKLRTFGKAIFEEELIGSYSPNSLQRLKDSFLCADIARCTADDIILSDEYTPSEISSSPDSIAELRIISSEGSVHIEEALCNESSILCHGYAVINTLYCNDGTQDTKEIFSTTRKLPFSKSLSCDAIGSGSSSSWDCRASGCCTDISCRTEGGCMFFDVTLSVCAEARHNSEIFYTKDIYSTESACSVVFEAKSYPINLKTFMGNFTFSEPSEISVLGIDPGSRIIYANGSASADKLECEAKKYIISGEFVCSLLTESGGELIPHRFTLPLKYEVDGTQEIPSDYDIELSVISTRARTDQEKLYIDAEIAVSAATESAVEPRVLSSATFGEKLSQRKNVCTVCYPDNADSLWSVGKRYCSDLKKITLANDLTTSADPDSPDSISGVRFLIV